VRVEFSNELWNFAFYQTHWAKDKAAEVWGDTSGTAFLDYQIMRATQVGLIWEDVFAETAEAPALVNVLGTQTVSEWKTERLLSGSGWKTNDPEGFIEPSLVFEELAVTTYFGSHIVSDETTRLELISAIEDPNVDATAWLTAKLLDPDHFLSVPSVLQQLKEIKTVADQFGMDLVAYEGGQHVHHSFSVKGLTGAQVSFLTEFMADYVSSPEMAILYEELWDAWAQVSDGSFMQFGDVGQSSKYGSWAILQDLNDANPRAEFLFDKMENATPWWDTEANSAYLHGVTETGTDGADVMVGTDQEDYFAGGLGDDTFILGGGNDGANGGDGIDRVLLMGNPASYTVQEQGKGHLVSGPSGEKFVINVETFLFETGAVLTLNEFLNYSDTNQAQEPVPETDHNYDENPDEANLQAVAILQLSGAVVDLDGSQAVEIIGEGEEFKGLKILGINKWSALGVEIGLKSGEYQTGYVAHEKGAEVSITDEIGAIQNYAANYYSLQDNIDGAKGEQITNSAKETALKFGNILLDPEAIHASGGDDLFLGLNSSEKVFGGAGRDFLAGNLGDDELHGGTGNDQLVGGAGADKFFFEAGDGKDRIWDFGVDDMIILDDYLDAGTSVQDAAFMGDRGHLVISNGEDEVTLEGLDIDDLSWVLIA